MGPGFESQRDHQMGQVGFYTTCPIFIFSKCRVHTVYQLDCLVQPRGSKISSVKSQFFRKDRTDYLTFLYGSGCLIDFVQVGKVIDSFGEYWNNVFRWFCCCG